ncbi:MAG TPA: MarR family transcriptional regulator [Acidimicrobiales bacterium]|nr:MarR family transcriptional regulator [Acidimicrobiales bacterium]
MSPVAATRELTDLAGRARLVVMRLARRIRQEGMGDEATPSMISALASIDRFGPLTLGELAAVEQVQPPTMTKIVARLEAAGYVVREVDAGDRRVARVQVTSAGHRFVERGRQRGAMFLAERLRTLSAEERAAVEAALPVLERLLDGDA